MKNLFRQVYIKHDNSLVAADNQKRLVISPRDFGNPFHTDAAVRDALNVLDHFATLKDADALYGSRESFWTALRAMDKRVLIIGSREVVAELLIQFWKSIFKAASAESTYRLYQIFIVNENLVSHHDKESFATDTNKTLQYVEALSREAFNAIYAKTVVIETLSTLKTRDIPVEYLLMNYFLDTSIMGQKTPLAKILFSKTKDIVLRNIVAQLHNAKGDFFMETHNFYLLDGPHALQTGVVDPLAEIKRRPELAWVTDDSLNPDNTAATLAKYTLAQLKEMFVTYTTLFRYKYDEEVALDYIIADDAAGLLEYDARDEMGNFFAPEYFCLKANGTLISYTYQLYRALDKATLRLYQLR